MSPGGRTPEERERARRAREEARSARSGRSAPTGPVQPGNPRPEIPEPEAPPPATPPPDLPPPPADLPPPPPDLPPPPPVGRPPADPVRPAAPPPAAVRPAVPRPTAAADPPLRAPVSAGSDARRSGLAVIAAAAAVLVLVVGWFFVTFFQPFKGAGGSGEVSLVVPQGADVGTVATLLSEKGVVSSAWRFRWRTSLSGKAADFKAGRYTFGRGMSYAGAIDLLADGPNAKITTVTVPEGRSRWETAQQVRELGLTGDYFKASEKSAELDPRRYGAPRSVASLEGFLFPATYELPAGADVDELVRQQLHAFKKQIGGVDMSYAKRKNLNVFDVLTIASLVEREVSVPSERARVAAVIYNRLKAGIALGIDATSRFETRNWTQPLTNSVLRSDTPYNTRINKGLPPGPIGSPGLAAIEAAAHPARSSDLYYVANPCKPGTHTFTKTWEEFERAVERYNQARERAGGKQPSGC